MPTREKPLRESTVQREAYFTDFAAKARKAAPGTVIMVTGGFRTRVGMAAAVQTGACDLIGVARPTAIEPGLPRDKMLNPKVSDEEAVVLETKMGRGSWIAKLPIIGLGMESVSIPIANIGTREGYLLTVFRCGMRCRLRGLQLGRCRIQL